MRLERWPQLHVLEKQLSLSKLHCHLQRVSLIHFTHEEGEPEVREKCIVV